MIYLANDHGGYGLGMKLFSKMVEKENARQSSRLLY